MRILSGLALPLSVALSMTALPAMAQDHCAMNDQTTLNISADSELKSAPDIATISAGVVTLNLKAEQSLKENSTQMNAIFEALKVAGIADKDMQTSGITLNPQYVYEQNKSPKITGYQANNNLTIVIRDLKKIGTVLDTLVGKGANQINGPSFTIENPDELLNKARKQAVAKARERAELYAEAAGMKVKRIISMSESTSSGPMPPYPMMRKMEMMVASDAGAPTPVAAGQVNLSANVNIVYELE